MVDLYSGHLYVFTADDGRGDTIYAIVDEVVAGSVRLGVAITEHKIVRDAVLPAGYGRIRRPSRREQEDFFRTLDDFCRQEELIGKCLSGDSECCRIRLKKVLLIDEPVQVEP